MYEHAGLNNKVSVGCMHLRDNRCSNAASLCNEVCTDAVFAQIFTQAACLSMNVVRLGFDGAEGIETSALEHELSATIEIARYYE